MNRFHLLRHITVAWSVCLSICIHMSSVTLVHTDKPVGQNEILFGRDTHVDSSNTVLDRGQGLHRKGRFGGQNPQFTTMPAIAKLLWPLYNLHQIAETAIAFNFNFSCYSQVETIINKMQLKDRHLAASADASAQPDKKKQVFIKDQRAYKSQAHMNATE